MPLAAAFLLLAASAAYGRGVGGSAATAPVSTSPADVNERTRTFHLDEGARVHLNWPAEAGDEAARRHLILFALPNGNTIEQTVGCRPREGLDWHYDIQHIGAQTRRLREIAPDERFVIAYLEADGRSWPGWKTRHADYLDLAPRIIHRVETEAAGSFDSVNLLAHSGGGSFIFAFIDSQERIPDRVARIAFLDANYGYRDEAGHADKLIAWLRADPGHVLNVVCYDDSHATLNGKFFLSAPDRGTWGSTGRMLYRFIKDIPLTQESRGPVQFFRGLDGRLEFILHTNPENKILHTALVGEMSGFLHAMTLAGPYEKQAGPFAGPITYEKWIQPEPLVTTTQPAAHP